MTSLLKKGKGLEDNFQLDITDLQQKLAELEIENKKLKFMRVMSAKNYENFFNTVDDLVFVLDTEGKIIHTNEIAITKLGYSRNELEGKRVTIIHPDELRDIAFSLLEKMLEGETEVNTIPLLTKTGSFIPAETRVKKGNWDGEDVIFVICKDVLKIRQSEEKFSTAFHLNPILMAIISYDNDKFVDVNEAFLKSMELSRNELIGKDFIEAGISVEPGLIKNIKEKLNFNVSIREVEVELETRSGRTLIFIYSADYIYVGNNLCLLIVAIDITNRKQTEAEILKARNEAEKANQVKSEFISRMSHELRTPMNAILGFAQLMSMGEISPSHRKGVNHIISSGKHLLDLINEVLDISRIESGRITLSPEPIRLAGIITEMIDVIGPVAIKRNIKPRLEASESDNLSVIADRQSLKQAIINLLSNAVKYNSEGGSVTVRTKLMAGETIHSSAVRILVSDTGPGIKPENLNRLFFPFERIGAEDSDIEGSGLGLSLVKKLVNAMDGDVGVESQPGLGSTFWIELPLSEPEANRDFSIEGTGGMGQPRIEKAGNILYVEDKKTNIDLIEEILLLHRPSVHLVSCRYGAQAPQYAIKNDVDLILLDLNLPDINGTSVLKNLKSDKRTSGIPVVILSAEAMPDRIKETVKAGAVQYLTQPLNLNSFLNAVDIFLVKKHENDRNGD